MAKYTVIFLLLIFTVYSPNSAEEKYNITEILKKAQENSSNTYESIDNIKYTVRSKTSIYLGFNPLRINLIPYFEEYLAEGYWEKPDSVSLKITALRVIGDINSSKKAEQDSVKEAKQDSVKKKSGVSVGIGKQFALPTPFIFYHDILGIKNDSIYIRPYYPFSAGSEEYYNYEIMGKIRSGAMDVLEIKVTPKFIDIPSVEGIFLLDAKTSSVVASDFAYNEAAKLTASIKIDSAGSKASIGATTRKTKEKKKFIEKILNIDEKHKVIIKKDLYYSRFWLPETMEEEFYIKILGMKVKVHRTIEFSSYNVNVPNFKEIQPAEKITYAPDRQDSLLSKPEYAAKLSKQEEEQMIAKFEDDILSGEIFDELVGDLTEIAKESARDRIDEKTGKYLKFAQKGMDFFRYNRIEGPVIGMEKKFSHRFIKRSAFSAYAGYGFNDKRWKWELAALRLFGKDGNFFTEAKAFNMLGFEESIKEISTTKNTLTSLFAKTDYRDYYSKEGYSVGLGYKFSKQLGAKLAFVSQNETGVTNNTKFSMFSWHDPFRLNPDIIEGRYNGIELTGSYNKYRFSADFKALYTDNKFLKSDFIYSLYKLKCRYNYRPTYNSRLFATVNGGTSSGAVAPQRWFDFGGKVFGNYTGELRGVGYKEFTGDRMFNGVAEYHVNGRVLKNIGLSTPFLSAAKFIFWSGIGWSELSDKSLHLVFDPDIKTFAPIYNYLPTKSTDGTYYEYGIGISDILNIFRLDFIHTNVDNKIMVGFNILR